MLISTRQARLLILWAMSHFVRVWWHAIKQSPSLTTWSLWLAYILTWNPYAVWYSSATFASFITFMPSTLWSWPSCAPPTFTCLCRQKLWVDIKLKNTNPNQCVSYSFVSPSFGWLVPSVYNKTVSSDHYIVCSAESFIPALTFLTFDVFPVKMIEIFFILF